MPIHKKIKNKKILRLREDEGWRKSSKERNITLIGISHVHIFSLFFLSLLLFLHPSSPRHLKIFLFFIFLWIGIFFLTIIYSIIICYSLPLYLRSSISYCLTVSSFPFLFLFLFPSYFLPLSLPHSPPLSLPFSLPFSRSLSLPFSLSFSTSFFSLRNVEFISINDCYSI